MIQNDTFFWEVFAHSCYVRAVPFSLPARSAAQSLFRYFQIGFGKQQYGDKRLSIGCGIGAPIWLLSDF
jgi:hypothetical protein